MIHNINTCTLCLLLLLLSFMIINTPSNMANSNASRSIIAPNTTIIIEISMIYVTIPFIKINTGIDCCRTAVTTITMTVVVTIATFTMVAMNTIMIIITSTRLLLILVRFFVMNPSVSTNPIMTTIIISKIANVCVDSSDRSSTTATIVVMVSINFKFITHYCGSYQY